MSTAALVNARASNGSTTVQTTQLHQQQQQPQSFGTTTSRASIGLSPKKTEEILLSENGKHETLFATDMVTDEKTEAQGELPQDKNASPIAIGAGKARKEANEEKNQMYPEDLRKILIEVAKSGSCPTLGWLGPHGELNEVRRLSSHQVGPPRKKQKNGWHAANRTGVKRPLSSRHHLSPAHSSRTSGSEMEDLSQYDSEGTANSEFSMDRARAQHLLNGVLNGLSSKHGGSSVASSKSIEVPKAERHKYNSLREVFRIATGAVLDNFFQKRGGYKLSPAEQRRNFILSSSNSKDSEKSVLENDGAHTAEEIFKQRKHRLLNLLSDPSDSGGGGAKLNPGYSTGAPFTIQRIAEVLLTPDRYYTQTHKLCNCLEKLLLVTSSISAFGGTTGGTSSQSRREEQEMAALADERGRLLAEYRRRRIQRTMSASSSEGDGHPEFHDAKQVPASPPKASSGDGKACFPESRRNEEMIDADSDKEDMQKEELLEAARASLRSKFDHVGIDPHSAVANANREQQSGNRSMTNSPPPPNYSGNSGGIGLSGHTHSGLLRAHHEHEHQGSSSPSHLVVRTPSPIMFKTTPEGCSSPTKASPTPVHPTHQNLQLLQMHHAAVLAGVSPFELMGLNGSGHAASVPHAPTVGTLSIPPAGSMMTHIKEMDVECRSSASSDVDSESDDVSFDDSASDRSDGSDSNEPSANSAVARTLALNRAQQQQHQQQQQQRRMLGSASSSAFSSGMGQKVQLQSSPTQQQQQHDRLHQQRPSPPTGDAAQASIGGREPEYQSGDSVDSLRADDSDSSLDMTD